MKNSNHMNSESQSFFFHLFFVGCACSFIIIFFFSFFGKTMIVWYFNHYSMVFLFMTELIIIISVDEKEFRFRREL